MSEEGKILALGIICGTLLLIIMMLTGYQG